MKILGTLVMALLLANAVFADEERSWTSQSGAFNVSIDSEIEPLPINRIHRWDIHIETASGEPVDRALISLTGGMPLHDHGLPTAPRMTAALGNGNYRLEGMRFHMQGDWLLTLTIEVDGKRDIVRIDLAI